MKLKPEPYVTEAELFVWREIVRGTPDKQMAVMRGTGIRCINKIRENLMRKLRVNCAVHVARMAIEREVISVETRPLTTRAVGSYIRHYL